MIKRLLLGIMIASSFIVNSYTQEVDELLEQVDFVLFVLQRNTLRMERYTLDELNAETNFLSKDISSDHCIFKIRMTFPNSRAQSIFWDFDKCVRLKVIAGRKKEPTIYYLPLEEVLPQEILVEDISLLFFECLIEHSKILKSNKKDTVVDWKTLVKVNVPSPDGESIMQLMLDGKVDAACGFFVEHNIFENDIPISGKIKIKDALDSGILVKEDFKPLSSDEDENNNKQNIDSSYCSKIKLFISSFFGSFV